MEKGRFYRVIYEGKEKPKPLQFQVICRPHGLLGVVFKASEGLGLFEEHRQRTEGCMEASIKPIMKEPFSVPASIYSLGKKS